MKITTILKERSRVLITLSGLLLVGIIGIFDYLTGPLFSSLAAYLVPVIFTTRLAGRTAGVVISAASSLTWVLAEIFSDPAHSFFIVHFWNLLEKLTIFLIVVLILLKIAKIEQERINLLSMLAHDMKNPALVIKGFSARLLKGKAGSLSKGQEDYVGLINREISRLERLIFDFLDMAKFESGTFKLNCTTFDILLNIKEHIDAFRDEADKKQINLVLEYAGANGILINADIYQIDRVIRNLIGNSIKYSSTGGNVTIKLALQSKYILIQVRDSGVGIAAEHIRHVFKPFYRIRNDHSGSGLGLSITRSIIKAHGGKIWVESTPGEGTIFSLALPR